MLKFISLSWLKSLSKYVARLEPSVTENVSALDGTISHALLSALLKEICLISHCCSSLPFGVCRESHSVLPWHFPLTLQNLLSLMWEGAVSLVNPITDGGRLGMFF